MNILIIAPQPFYLDRGTPMNTKLICKVLGDAGHSIDLVVFPTGRMINLRNVRIIQVLNILKSPRIPIGPSKEKIFFDILLTFYCFILAASKKYTVFHGIEEGGFIAVVLCKMFGGASIYDMDSSISEQLQYSRFVKSKYLLKLVKYIEKWTIMNSSLIITVCSSLTEKTKKYVNQQKVLQLEDIPVQNEKNHSGILIKKIAGKYSLGMLKKVIYTGNLEKYQGIDLLLEAWDKVVSRNNYHNNTKLLIVGGSKEKIDKYRRYNISKIAKKTILWVGQRPLSEMSAWMELSDVLVSPRFEGDNTPLKIYSYMASGKPIVATRKRTHTQVLDSQTAFLCEANADSMSKEIINAIESESMAKKKGFAARNKVFNDYNYNTFRKKLIGLYNNIDKNNRKK